MKRINKVIGLIVTFALVISVLFTISVESKADSAPSGFPQVGDEITCGTCVAGDIPSGTQAQLTVQSITAHVVSSENWTNSVIVYFYKFEPNHDAGFDGTYSYVIHKVTGYYFLDRDQTAGKTDDELVEKYLNTLKTDSQTGDGSIQNKIDTLYSMRWNIQESTPTPAPAPGPKPAPPQNPVTHVHNWQHGVITPATEDTEGVEGDYCLECDATRNISTIPCTYAIMDNRIQQIEWASPSKISVLEMKTLCSLPKYFMQMIDQKKDCDFTLRFTYEKKHYELYIPAGTEFEHDLDWYGPEKLLTMFEYKVLY